MNWIVVVAFAFASVSCRPTSSRIGDAEDRVDLDRSDAGERTTTQTPWLSFESVARPPHNEFPGNPAHLPDADVSATALPSCTGFAAVGLPSPLINFSMLPSNGPFAHEGTATVTEVRRTAQGLPFAVAFEWTDSEGTISLANSGAIFPDLVIGQTVQVNMLGTSAGIIAQSVVIIRDPAGDWMLASYNFDDRFIRDGSVRRLLGFDVVLREICEDSASECSQSPTRLISGAAVMAESEIELPIGQAVDAQIDGLNHKLVWRGGRTTDGPPTGNCTDVILGTSVAFLVSRQ